MSYLFTKVLQSSIRLCLALSKLNLNCDTVVLFGQWPENDKNCLRLNCLYETCVDCCFLFPHRKGAKVTKNIRRREHRSFWISVWGKLGQQNHIRWHCFRKETFLLNENEKQTISNSSCLKNVFEKLRFHDGLAWTVSLICVFKFLWPGVDAALILFASRTSRALSAL